MQWLTECVQFHEAGIANVHGTELPESRRNVSVLPREMRRVLESEERSSRDGEHTRRSSDR